MKIIQYVYHKKEPQKPPTNEQFDLALVFGDRYILADEAFMNSIKLSINAETWLMASTSGEIAGSEVHDETVVATLIKFNKTKLRTAIVNINDVSDSFEAGKNLINQLIDENPCHIFVLSDGTKVNGSELANGMNSVLPEGVAITGGLAGDADRFQETIVSLNDDCRSGNIAAVAFYGSNLRVGHGSKGGWDSFGPDRKITKASANVLYELDGKSALQLYKEYLGELANDLPSTALLFPLALRSRKDSQPLVRTILGINEVEQSMTFAGDMPIGSYARLMRANFDRLIDAASVAANDTLSQVENQQTELAILISCVGRKLVLNQRVDEEVESVRHMLGKEAVITGFYSYGEISPLAKSMKCELHNQTMTITTLSET